MTHNELQLRTWFAMSIAFLGGIVAVILLFAVNPYEYCWIVFGTATITGICICYHRYQLWEKELRFVAWVERGCPPDEKSR